MSELMSSGEVARQLGISLSLVRKLEREGVTPPARRVAGVDRRVYTTIEVEALRQIIADRRAGMSHAEQQAA